MRKVTCRKRLRPLRFAFLIRPDDREAFLKAVEINTCLWGGQYNAIFATYKHLPTWWFRDKHRSHTAREVALGSINCFEPDYIVCMSEGLADGLGLEEWRVLTPSLVLNVGWDSHVVHGLSVIPLYAHLFRHELRFVRRDPLDFVIPVAADKDMQLFAATCFGQFPTDQSLSAFTENYKACFQPEALTVQAHNILSLLTERTGTPLRIGSSNLEIRRRRFGKDLYLFYMDASVPRDLIDFWNLRALGQNILPIAKQWEDVLVSQCRDMAERLSISNSDPLHTERVTVLRSRSVSERDTDDFAAKIRPTNTNNILLQYWYPSLWDNKFRDQHDTNRCELHALGGSEECIVQDERITLNPIYPTFINDRRWHGTPKWANVVQIDELPLSPKPSLVLPRNFSDIGKLLTSAPFDAPPSVSSEGLVMRCDGFDRPVSWHLPDGSDVFVHWLKHQGIVAKQSSAGHIARQVLHSLDGPFGARILMNTEIVKCLDRMSHGLIEMPASEGDLTNRRGTRGRIENRSNWVSLLAKAHKCNHEQALRYLNELTTKGVLRLGIRIQCETCFQWNWYPLGQITEKLPCERCLRDFRFPVAQPPRDPWYYRTQGPFSIDNYAEGSYSVAFALHFLVHGLHGDSLWTTGLEMKDTSGKHMEVDFALWWKGQYSSSDPYLIFGECKSFNSFLPKDISRAAEMVKRFPGAIFIFATLRQTLDNTEKMRLRKLAQSLRERYRSSDSRSSVMVLTAHELLYPGGPPYCWRDAGSKIASFANSEPFYDNILELCDVTQQIHLEMEPYSQWLEVKLRSE